MQTSTPDPVGYQVDDLIIDLASRRVSRAGTLISLKSLSFDLLVTLARAAPDLLSFEQLSERVWPGLVVTPETIVQRVKLLRSALGDDAQAPRYIEGVRGRGYRMLADTRALDDRPALAPPVDTPAVARRPDRSGPVRWVGGATMVVAVLAAGYGVLSHERGSGRPSPSGGAASPPAIRSLVVLPVENLSGDKEQEYFADGMTDALTTDLAQIGSLKVISRTSAMHFKGSPQTLPQIGHALKVDAVVAGTVVRSDNRVRFTAQLIETRTDHHLWARTYERDLKDVLALQDEIAQDISREIRVQLSPHQRTQPVHARAVDPEAYDLSIKGWYWLDRAEQEAQEAPANEAARKVLDYFQKAIAKDPRYAPPYAGLAEYYLALDSQLSRQEACSQSRHSAEQALALDPSLAEAHTTLGRLNYRSWNWPGADAEYRQATALNPSSATAHYWFSFYLLSMGRIDDAMHEIERAQELDPFSAAITNWAGQVLYHARRYDDALRQNMHGLEMHPDDGQFYWENADIYEQKQMFAEAFTARQHALGLANSPHVGALAAAYKQSGYSGYLLKQAELFGLDNPAYTAHLYARLGDHARAEAALEAAYDQHNPGVLFLRTAPEMDSIRSSPRIRDLVRRIGFPPSPDDHG